MVKISPKRNAGNMLASFALSGVGLGAAHPAVAAPTLYNFVAGVPPNTAGDPLYTGGGVLGNGAAAVWNTVNYSGSSDQNITTNAQDSNGQLSTVTIQYGAQAQYNNVAGSERPASTSDTALLQNFALSRNGQQDNIDLSGLPPNAAYTLVIYGTNGPLSAAGNETTRFAVLSGEAGQAGTKILQEATTTETTDARFQTPANYVKFAGKASAQGQVFLSFVGTGKGPDGMGPEGDFNGLQIEVEASK